MCGRSKWIERVKAKGDWYTVVNIVITTTLVVSTREHQAEPPFFK